MQPARPKDAPAAPKTPPKAYNPAEYQRRMKYKAARNTGVTASGYAKVTCRLHSRVHLTPVPDGDLKNPKSLEWREAYNEETGNYEWVRCCRPDSRCQRTVDGVSGPSPPQDDFAEAIIAQQLWEKDNRWYQNRRVIRDSTDWQPPE